MAFIAPLAISVFTAAGATATALTTVSAVTIAASSAMIGAVAGGIYAAVKGESVLKGALKGGVLAGAGGFLAATVAPGMVGIVAPSGMASAEGAALAYGGNAMATTVAPGLTNFGTATGMASKVAGGLTPSTENAIASALKTNAYIGGAGAALTAYSTIGAADKQTESDREMLASKMEYDRESRVMNPINIGKPPGVRATGIDAQKNVDTMAALPSTTAQESIDMMRTAYRNSAKPTGAA